MGYIIGSYMTSLKNKILLITGGTGSFGNAVLRTFLDSDLKEIRIFSRDEKKQDDMRKKYQSSKLKFFLGNVREKSTIDQAMSGVDLVFHAAALKQVPSCEFFPMEAVKTNIIGTDNVLTSAIENKVEKVVVLSTDKAVYPINAMGMSKAMAEKVAIAKARNLDEKGTVICCTRYGNVLASRGSVVPLFVEQIKNKNDLTITDGKMTRFMMTLDDAVELVMFAFEHGQQGDIFVQKAPASTIETLATALIELFHSDSKIKVIGTRHGEKVYETLVNREEMSAAEDFGRYYRIRYDHRDLNYTKYLETGKKKITNSEEYTSHNTTRLDIQETKKMLLKTTFIKDCL